MKPVHRRRVIQLFAASAAFGLSPVPARAGNALRHWSGLAMGADASLTIRHEDAREAERLLWLARQEISRLESIFSLYRSQSALSRLNREERLNAPPQDLLGLLSLCGAIHRATEGAFDPAIQALWEYHAQTLSGVRPVDEEEFLWILDRSGWAHLEVSPDLITFQKPGAALTLNGIAQGYATDKVVALLRANGLEHVLASVGEIAAMGERAPDEPWRIGLNNPTEGEGPLQLILKDLAIATTAPLATTLDPAGRIGHIINPRSGLPAQSQWRQISVIHPSAAIADGLSTGMALLDKAAIERSLQGYAKARVIAFNQSGEKIML